MNPQRGILFACLLVVVTNRGATAQHAIVQGTPSDKCENPSVNIATTEAQKSSQQRRQQPTQPRQPNPTQPPVQLFSSPLWQLL
ncbi:uncharacterized protein CELE_F49H6.15 [Caenorhabditis elegans]|uniref:Secreted protein n=1 Tax=Caenorhabditis elegans TaxID=6239 RepID=A8DZ51_CAEEL|nr:Secreted protein [Caenorhabditis elegans]CAP09181.1 Secreted protein [Caenorhabditis elegans]|eukprot:NP_001122944.1 Uncharacterized protein CELE_F49H6.15 [Caenorhabditis elegans]